MRYAYTYSLDRPERIAGALIKSARNGGKGNRGTNESKHDQSVGFYERVVSGSVKTCMVCTMVNAITATECFMCFTKFDN